MVIITIQELINVLNTIKDKSKIIGFRGGLGEFRTIDSLVGVSEWADVVELNNEVIVPRKGAWKDGY